MSILKVLTYPEHKPSGGFVGYPVAVIDTKYGIKDAFVNESKSDSRIDP